MRKFWEPSQCKIPGYLHDFKIEREEDGAVLERCSRCNRTAVLSTNIFNGDVHFMRDVRMHLREQLQQGHPRYLKEYNK
jgi:hypothetical protein